MNHKSYCLVKYGEACECSTELDNVESTKTMDQSRNMDSNTGKTPNINPEKEIT